MLDVRGMAMTVGQRCLFKDVDLIFLPKHRYGIVGANGTGKSTFLRGLAGEESTCAGSVEKAKNTSIGILKQDHFRYENDRVVDVVIQGKAELWNALIEKQQLLEKIEWTEEDGYRLADLEEIIAHEDGYNAEAVAKNMLAGLGVLQKYHEGPLSALSGGYKLRVLLAQVTFQKPDVMLLDEPTNHLDILSIAWLENFLITEFTGTLAFISHDRDFLNRISTDILDVDYETITKYVGNYDRYIAGKELALEQKQSELAGKEKQIEHLQSFVDRFGAKASKARQAASRQKMIDRIEVPEIKSSSVVKPYFKFIPEKKSAKKVLEAQNLSKQFGEALVLNKISFTLNRGEKCAIIGPNGIGKSTLLNVLLEKIPATDGNYEWSDTVSIGYFAQDYHQQLPTDQTVWQWMENTVSAPAQDIRAALGQSLFRGTDVNKKISVLSGGESARLVLASIVLKKHNVLILDEPTNHLDLESIDALSEALVAFEGSILFVSHNRYFIDQIATRVIALTPHHGVKHYAGNYNDYLEQYGLDYLSSE